MSKRTSIAAGLTALMLIAAPAALTAQDGSTISVDARGGVEIPVSDFADVADLGPTAGASLRYRAHSRIDVRIDGELGVLSGIEGGDLAGTPDVELWRALAGLNARLLGAASSLDISVYALGGITSYNTKLFPEVVFEPETGEPVGDFAETYPTVSGGLEIAYPVFSSMDLTGDLFLRGSGTMMFTEEADTEIFSQLRSGAGGFDRGMTIPVTLGLKLGF